MSRIFISYAREDAATAIRLYQDLKAAGLEPWLDSEELLPGQDWKSTVGQAIRSGSFFIALISEKSVSKRGFAQKEIHLGLDILDECPPGQIYVIPARLDRVKPSYPKLEQLHRVDLFPSYTAGIKEILEAIEQSTSEAKSSRPDTIEETLKKQRIVHALEIDKIKIQKEAEIELLSSKHMADMRDYKDFVDSIDSAVKKLQDNYVHMPVTTFISIHHHMKRLLNDMWDEPDLHKRIIREDRFIKFLTVVYEDLTQAEANGDQGNTLPQRTIKLIKRQMSAEQGDIGDANVV